MTKVIKFKKSPPNAAQIETILGLPAGSITVSVDVPSYEVTITAPDGINPTDQQKADLKQYLKECLAYDKFAVEVI